MSFFLQLIQREDNCILQSCPFQIEARFANGLFEDMLVYLNDMNLRTDHVRVDRVVCRVTQEKLE